MSSQKSGTDDVAGRSRSKSGRTWTTTRSLSRGGSWRRSCRTLSTATGRVLTTHLRLGRKHKALYTPFYPEWRGSASLPVNSQLPYLGQVGANLHLTASLGGGEQQHLISHTPLQRRQRQVFRCLNLLGVLHFGGASSGRVLSTCSRSISSTSATTRLCRATSAGSSKLIRWMGRPSMYCLLSVQPPGRARAERRFCPAPPVLRRRGPPQRAATMASLMFSNASSIVSPWLWQPDSARQEIT